MQELQMVEPYLKGKPLLALAEGSICRTVI